MKGVDKAAPGAVQRTKLAYVSNAQLKPEELTELVGKIAVGAVDNLQVARACAPQPSSPAFQITACPPRLRFRMQVARAQQMAADRERVIHDEGFNTARAGDANDEPQRHRLLILTYPCDSQVRLQMQQAGKKAQQEKQAAVQAAAAAAQSAQPPLGNGAVGPHVAPTPSQHLDPQALPAASCTAPVAAAGGGAHSLAPGAAAGQQPLQRRQRRWRSRPGHARNRCADGGRGRDRSFRHAGGGRGRRSAVRGARAAAAEEAAAAAAAAAGAAQAEAEEAAGAAEAAEAEEAAGAEEAAEAEEAAAEGDGRAAQDAAVPAAATVTAEPDAAEMAAL